MEDKSAYRRVNFFPGLKATPGFWNGMEDYHFRKEIQTTIKKEITVEGKIQIIETYDKNITYETAKIPKDYTETFVSTDLETTTIEGKEYCKFIIENKVYYVSKN